MYRIVPAVQMEGEYVKGTTLYPDEVASGPFVTKTGKVLTDTDVEALADEAERSTPADVVEAIRQTGSVVGINFDPELVAMQKMADALRNLSETQRRRVIRWAWARFVSDPSSSIRGGS
jgi:hypothetical protein